MDERPAQKPANGYAKRSKLFWVVVYLVVAVIVYGIIYLVFIHKGSPGKGFSY